MNRIVRQLRNAARVLRDEGLLGARMLLVEKRHNRREARRYRRWLETKGRLTEADRNAMRSAIDGFRGRPLISIILPVYNVDEKWLRHCLDSVAKQIYPNWELCIADDASTAPHIRPLLTEYARRDERIKVSFRTENGHISAASNSAVGLATGEFVVLLDHDDELSEDALFWVASEINSFPETAMIYSDEDLMDEGGRRYDPKFKPDFSRDLLYSTNLVTHLSGYRTALLRSIGGFRVGFEGSQDYDLALRVIEQVTEDRIRHIPRVLYHWRVIKGSVAFAMEEKSYAHERARLAIREHLERSGYPAATLEAAHNLHRVVYRMPEPEPSVSMIVSSEDEDAHASIKRAEFNEARYQIIFPERSYATRAEWLNEAAARATGDVIVFVDSSLFPRNIQVVDELVRVAIQDGIGAVGAKILRGDMFVEHTGLVIGPDLTPHAAHYGFPRSSPGNISRNVLIGNCSAVSLSCMVVSRRVFESCGGFDTSVPCDLMDVDLCFRFRETGRRIVVVPDVEFVRRGKQAVRKVADAELKRFRQRWSKYSERDPFCNPNLKRDGSFEIDV
ncbi:MAG TPA: glycosyltransferase [Pyrinomonadaceae bacterium]